MDFATHVELARALSASTSLESPRSLAIVESRLRRGDWTPVHVHETPEAFHVLEGVLAVFVGGRSSSSPASASSPQAASRTRSGPPAGPCAT